MNEMHEANRKGWNAATAAGKVDYRAEADWRKCHKDASITLCEQELKWLDDISGKTACVLGSGDNRVVFALAGLGAQVTSVDISEEQLRVAGERAGEIGLDIRFVRADVTDLSELNDNTFDIIYTGGHVAVWVSDLSQFYREAGRILNPGGVFMVNEYHPVRRIWKDSGDELKLEFDYFDTGPHQWERSEDVPDAEPGSLPSYEFHWTVSQYIMAVMNAGCEIIHVDEFGTEPESHETGPRLTGLPRCLLVIARKKSG